MINDKNIRHERIFEIFEELSAIPRGSGYMDGISEFCIDFAKKNGLRYVTDDAKNVIIYKKASRGFEHAEPVILQGHLDMVWQKTEDCDIDFTKDGITLERDGDFIRARGTTLGADNGIAVAMTLAILESHDIPHPPIEAVFTTDEEIGMLGAIALDTSLLSAKKLINLDSEEDDTVTVSCAGGSDFRATLPLTRERVCMGGITVKLHGLKGGHSGVEIAAHRVNAAMLAGRILNRLSEHSDIRLVSVDSGNKANAIPSAATFTLTCEHPSEIAALVGGCIAEIRTEIAHHEPNFEAEVSCHDFVQRDVMSEQNTRELIYALTCSPCGIIEMSSEIEGLVETSLNLGILKTDRESVSLGYALRSSKASALAALGQKMSRFFSLLHVNTEQGGYYPPWEYRADSPLTALYVQAYREKFGKAPKVEAIHAGLECAIFSSAISGVDCIAIGPSVLEAHTPRERLSISSAETVYELLLDMLEKMANCK